MNIPLSFIAWYSVDHQMPAKNCHCNETVHWKIQSKVHNSFSQILILENKIH